MLPAISVDKLVSPLPPTTTNEKDKNTHTHTQILNSPSNSIVSGYINLFKNYLLLFIEYKRFLTVPNISSSSAEAATEVAFFSSRGRANALVASVLVPQFQAIKAFRFFLFFHLARSNSSRKNPLTRKFCIQPVKQPGNCKCVCARDTVRFLQQDTCNPIFTLPKITTFIHFHFGSRALLHKVFSKGVISIRNDPVCELSKQTI